MYLYTVLCKIVVESGRWWDMQNKLSKNLYLQFFVLTQNNHDITENTHRNQSVIRSILEIIYEAY